MHHSSNNSHESSKLLYIYVGVIVGLAIIFADKIKGIAPLFQLTVTDVNMIPFGAAFFIIFWKLAERFLFQPFLALNEAREAATSGSEEESISVAQQAKKLLDDAEAQLFAARGKAMRQKDESLAQVRATCAQEVASATVAAKLEVEKQRQIIAAECDNLRSSLNEQVEQLARDAAQKIKGGVLANGGSHA
jgi:F0F1-type ATP synthase membrane subunit b/b'